MLISSKGKCTLAVLALLGAFVLCWPSLGDAIEELFRPASEQPNPIVEIRDREARLITTLQVNMFHEHFISRVMPHLPRAVFLSYDGVVAHDNGRLKHRAVGVIGNPVGWRLTDRFGVFNFIISTTESHLAVARTRLDNTDIYLIPTWIADGQEVDDPLDSLGGRSVREVLKMMEVQPEEE